MASKIRPFLRAQHLRGVFSPSSFSTPQAILQTSIRNSTRASSTTTTTKTPQVPPPIPLVPDVETFLTVIGRNLKQHASKIPDWETLFTLTSVEFRELGVEPARSRRYLVQWLHRFRLGQFGTAGDLRHVQDGMAELRILEGIPKPGATEPPRKVVVNVPPGRNPEDCDPSELTRVLGYHVVGANTISGPYAKPMKGGGGSLVEMTEGMWEHRLGQKVDGGERRQAEVRYKRRIAERREAREKAGGY